jgi:hypothetical protein
MTWKEQIEARILADAAAFTARQIAEGKIHPDSIAAMTASDIRSGMGTPAPKAEPTESEAKATQKAAQEQDWKVEHALRQSPAQMSADDKNTLRAAIAAWERGGRQ